MNCIKYKVFTTPLFSYRTISILWSIHSRYNDWSFYRNLLESGSGRGGEAATTLHSSTRISPAKKPVCELWAVCGAGSQRLSRLRARTGELPTVWGSEIRLIRLVSHPVLLVSLDFKRKEIESNHKRCVVSANKGLSWTSIFMYYQLEVCTFYFPRGLTCFE